MMNRPRPLLPKPPRPPAGADFYETHTIACKKVSIRKVSAKLAKKSKNFTDLVWGSRTSSGARTPGGRPWSTPLPVTPAHFSYPPPSLPVAAPPMADGVTTLTGLAGLLSMGALTQAEFDAAKERAIVKHGLK